MKNAIVLHGMPGQEEYYNPAFPSASNSHWLPWLQKQLLIHDIAAQTPEVPNAWKPDYETWRKEFERYDITSETMLVGHSCGGGFLVRWLSEHPDIHVGKVVLVAPWLDPDRSDTTDFFEFSIDPKLKGRTADLMIFNSDNDMHDVHQSVKMIREVIENAAYREFHNYGHFCFENLKTVEFPELRDELLSSSK
jgi:predicted alpha/beta hydrolase family esterase